MCVLVIVVRLVCVRESGASASVSSTRRWLALTHSTSLQQSPRTHLPSHSPCEQKGQSTPAPSTAHHYTRAVVLLPLPALLLKAIPSAAMSPEPRPPAPRLHPQVLARRACLAKPPSLRPCAHGNLQRPGCRRAPTPLVPLHLLAVLVPQHPLPPLSRFRRSDSLACPGSCAPPHLYHQYVRHSAARLCSRYAHQKDTWQDLYQRQSIGATEGPRHRARVNHLVNRANRQDYVSSIRRQSLGHTLEAIREAERGMGVRKRRSWSGRGLNEMEMRKFCAAVMSLPMLACRTISI